jgi:CRP-like cAMP-binding protein
MSEEHSTMREDEEVELLSKVDLLESLSKEEIRELIRQNSEVRLGEGETFYAPWEQGGKLFILKKEIRIPTRYSHEHLGTMIGANREAVTRAFGRLQDEGALQIRRRLIYVDDVQALERAAGRLLEEEEEGLS